MAMSTTAPAWHQAAHLPLRREVMARLREHPILAVNPALQRDAARHGMPSLLQRLEWMLYHAAHSLSEYANADSLERRVQALVTHYKRQAASSGGDSEADAPLRQRRRRSATSEEAALPTKRSRNDATSETTDGRIQVTAGDDLRPCRGCSLGHNLDLLRHVFSFLDGREALRSRAVSRFFLLHSPSFVCTLRFDGSEARTSHDAAGLSSLLLQCSNLSEVSIGSSSNMGNVKAGVVFPRALAQPTDAAAASFGRQVAMELTHAIARGGCRKLEALELHAPFDFANESDAALGLVKALASESSDATAAAAPRRAPLKRLVLDATFMGDKGVLELAQVMQRHADRFRSLATLSVRNNFVGEGGCQALLEMIQACLPRLRALDLRQNILTDVDAIRIADLLDQPAAIDASSSSSSSAPMNQAEGDDAALLAVPRLRSVELDGNFIGCEGYHAISIALCARREAVGGSSGCEEDSQSDDLDGVDGVFPSPHDDEPMQEDIDTWA